MSQENEQQIRAATNESIKSEENGEKCQSLFPKAQDATSNVFSQPKDIQFIILED